MSTWEVWVTIIGMSAVMIAIRNAFVLLPDWTRPRWPMNELVRYGAIGALAAITFPDFWLHAMEEGRTLGAMMNEGSVPAALLALMAGCVTRNGLVGLSVGIVALIIF